MGILGRRSIGVEEEFLLVDPADGQVRAMAAAALGADAARHEDRDRDGDGDGDGDGDERDVEAELQLQQLETSTDPCRSLTELGEQLRQARRQASAAARAVGVDIAALASSPLPAKPAFTPSRRYRRLRERFGLLAEDQLTCGCHIHVEVGSDEEGVAVVDRIRSWLAPMVALAGNSPFWQGEDSSYASYRTQVWSRWPSAGPTELFGSARAYHETVRAMTESRTVLDSGMVYFDARLSRQYPTVEIRVADVCLHADDAVLLAALARALVGTAARQWRDGRAAQPVRLELLRLAAWRASRYGLDAALLDPATMRPAPARTVLDSLLEHVRDDLEEVGDHADVSELYGALLGRGNGARLQRAAHDRASSLADVVADGVRRTLAG
jgi:glutamate---cysteine ligase / carboxylate-amine ligase